MLGNPLKVGGGKFTITSCLLETCRKMGGQRKFGVKTLEEDESWSLFVERLGNETIIPQEVEGVAKSMVNKCTSGLPLGIITLAKRLRELELDSVDEWRKVLESIANEESFKGENKVTTVFLLLLFVSRR
ncbi:putative disease resistance protein [Capsicum chacoense]